MNEGEITQTSSATGEMSPPSYTIADRSQRRSHFNSHVDVCAICGDDSNDLCDQGHRLLRQAID